MDRDKLRSEVIYCLVNFCEQDEDGINNEIQSLGDAEINSVIMIEVLPYLEVKLGINIHPMWIHKNVKTLNDLCDLIKDKMI